MQIVYHIGANCTDGERLLRSLMRNTDGLRTDGVRIPGPGRYRQLLRETIAGLGDGTPSDETRDVLLDAIIDDQDVGRLVLSNSTFLSQPSLVFENGAFYGKAQAKVRALCALFSKDEIEIHIGLRNPATFVPAVWGQANGRDFKGFMGGLDPVDILWSDVLTRIRDAAPNALLTVWCNEDTVLIWSEVLRHLAGVAPDRVLEGEYDLLTTVMQPEGMKRFLSYMAAHPGQTDAQIRRVIGAFLDKYANLEEIEETVDLPGWDARLVENLTRAYETDVERIAAMKGVNFIAP